MFIIRNSIGCGQCLRPKMLSDIFRFAFTLLLPNWLLISIRIYSGIARFPCDSMAFLLTNDVTHVLTAVGDGCQLVQSDVTSQLLTYYTLDGHLVANVTCRHGYRFQDDDNTWRVIRCVGTSWSDTVPMCRHTSDSCKMFRQMSDVLLSHLHDMRYCRYLSSFFKVNNFLQFA